MNEEELEGTPDEFVHGYCLDCGSPMSDKWMFNNVFAQAGAQPSCPRCGGVVAIMDSRKSEAQIREAKLKRGVPLD